MSDEPTNGQHGSLSYERIAQLWDILSSLTDAQLVAQLGIHLHTRAVGRPDDELLIGAARVAKALWVALRARDGRVMAAFERIALSRLSARDAETESLAVQAEIEGQNEEAARLRWRDAWAAQELPPREHMDRKLRLGELLETAAAYKAKMSGNPTLLAKVLIDAVGQLVPQFALKADTTSVVEQAAVAIADRITRTADREGSTISELKEELIVLEALLYLAEPSGVSRKDIHNWLSTAIRV